MTSRRTYTEDEVINMLDDDDLDLGDEICFEGSDDQFSAGEEENYEIDSCYSEVDETDSIDIHNLR